MLSVLLDLDSADAQWFEARISGVNESGVVALLFVAHGNKIISHVIISDKIY